MTSSITFDTLASARRLRERGIPQEQAEAIAEELRLTHSFDAEHFRTKPDAELFKSEMRHDFQMLRSEMQMLEAKMGHLEHRIVVKLGVVIGAATAFLAAIQFFQ